VFAGQYIFGLLFYLFPVVTFRLKVAYMPIHVMCGLIGFALAVVACLIGICEKSYNGSDYKLLSGTTVLVNSIGLLLVVYGYLVIYLVTEPSYKRQPLPEEMPIMASGVAVET
jgi:membrane associated rhomboid family serine protease